MKSQVSDRDGPTKEFESHHGVVPRDSRVGGKRVQGNLEDHLLVGRITPEEADAGRRFASDFLIGTHRPSPSPLSLSFGGGGGDDGADFRSKALDRYNAARLSLDGQKSNQAIGRSPHHAMIMFAVDNETFGEIGRWWDVLPDTARDRIFRMLGKLVKHYEAADTASGRSETPHSAQDALKRLRPAELEED